MNQRHLVERRRNKPTSAKRTQRWGDGGGGGTTTTPQEQQHRNKSKTETMIDWRVFLQKPTNISFITQKHTIEKIQKSFERFVTFFIYE